MKGDMSLFSTHLPRRRAGRFARERYQRAKWGLLHLSIAVTLKMSKDFAFTYPVTHVVCIYHGKSSGNYQQIIPS